MNLLENARIKRHWPASGSLIPGTNCFERIPPEWSPPAMRVIEGNVSDYVAQQVSELLADPDVHVCAVSPAAISMAGAGVETYSWTAVTALVQQRIPPAALAQAQDVAQMDTTDASIKHWTGDEPLF